MHETHLTRGNLDYFKGSHWIGNDVNPICKICDCILWVFIHFIFQPGDGRILQIFAI